MEMAPPQNLNVLIIGATSAIAKATARIYATEGASLYLVGRNKDVLKLLQEDLLVRGAKDVDHTLLDVNEYTKHQSTIDSALNFLGSIDIAIICHGTLLDLETCIDDTQKTFNEISTNGVSTVLLLTSLGSVIRAQSKGTIAVVTSVAGDRGRRSNYVYGSAKALVSTFLEGFRSAMLEHNVHVIDIRPGFVDTPMTAHVQNKGVLWATPEKVAMSIVSGIKKKKHVVYTPFFWRFIMLFVKAIPIPIFKRLKF